MEGGIRCLSYDININDYFTETPQSSELLISKFILIHSFQPASVALSALSHVADGRLLIQVPGVLTSLFKHTPGGYSFTASYCKATSSARLF